MNTPIDYYSKSTSPQAQQLYDHLLHLAQSVPPSEMIERFRHLFLDTAGYDCPQVSTGLQELALSKQAEEEFRFIINRCFYILVNTWQIQPQLQAAIPELIALLEEPVFLGGTNSRGVRRVREMMKLFHETDQSLTLRRLGQVFKAQEPIKGSSLVGNLIQRYPYLYGHCLLSEESDYQQKRTVQNIQERSQQKFETDLSHYVTYQVRLAQRLRAGSSREIEVVENPTLLSDRELGSALKQYVGKIQGGKTHRDIADSFIAHSQHLPNYKTFKQDFYQYLTMAIDPAFGKRRFNDNLYNHLLSVSPQNDSKKPDEFMIIRTCSQVLNYLVVESLQKPQHFVFVDLITNLGATYTIGLLLKIVMICNKVKPYLEKRFAILFNHYETFSKDGVPWLVKSLENLNVGLSIHFGDADVSCISHLMQLK